MNVKTKINISLLITVICLVLILYVTSENEEQAQAVYLTNMQPERISTIRIERSNHETITFQRQKQQWEITSPFQATAHETRIKAILHILQAQSFSQMQVKDQGLQRFELEHPAVTLYLDDHKFSFGTTNPLEDRRYVMYQDTIHLIDDYLFQQLRQDASFFINTRLLPEDLRITSIQFPDYSIEKLADKWTVSPQKDIDQEQLKTLVEAWQDAIAVSARLYHGGNTIGTVQIKTSMDRAMRFEIIKQQPNLILARTDLGIEYDIPKYLAEELFLDVATEGTENLAR